MRIKLVDHSARRLELDYPDDRGRSRILGVEYLTEVGGTIERDPPSVHLRPLTVKECQVSGLDWHLRQGHVSIGTPATLAMLHLEGTYTSNPSARWPFQGSIAWESLDAERVKVELPNRRLSLDVRGEKAAVTLSADEGGQAAFRQLAVRNLQTAVGEALLRVSSAIGQNARLRWGAESTHLEAASASLRGLVIQKRDFEIEIDQVELPKGITMRDGRIEAREVVLGRMQLVIHDVHALATARPPEAPAEPAAPAQPEAGAGRSSFRSLDPMLLDRLHGQLDVDLTVDATMPVIGRRRATHHFRVPIEHGTIDFRELEHDLARLEDAVIDFEVRNGNLVLERDVPLIPGLHKPLVLWPLNDVERGLAKKHIVRLRTLLAYRMPEKAEVGSEDKPRVVFRRLDFDNIGIAVALRAPGEEGSESHAELGGPVPDAGLADLRVAGFVRHCFEGEQEPGAVSIVASGLDATLRGLRLGGARADAASARVDAIEEVSMTFDGLRPRRLTATIRGLRLTDACLVV